MSEKNKAILDTAKKRLVTFKSLFDPLLEATISTKKFNELLAETIIPLGIALSAEKDTSLLLYKILNGAKNICNADAGTLYLKSGNQLDFNIVLNSSLGFDIRTNYGEKSSFPPIIVFDEATGEYNYKNVASVAAIKKEMIHIEDAYENDEFDFSGTKIFDKKNEYRSKSFLTIPLLNYHQEVTGVLQLINCVHPRHGEVIPFTEMMCKGVQSLASLAATAIENQMLLEAEKELLNSFIKLISGAIDKKSPYTGGHCSRVPDITLRIAEAAIKKKEGVFERFDLNESEKYELQTAAWLHDIGKITTPEYVVDKATKLETIFDRIEIVKLRVEMAIKDLQIVGLKDASKKESMDQKIIEMKEIMSFLYEVNLGGEFLSDEDIQKINDIAAMTYINSDGEECHLLKEDEVMNLSIRRGTLNDEERKTINQHIDVTIEMLEALPFPKHLQRVVEYAGGHHEKMDGTGYPKGLRGDQMSIPARIMAVADIFEALTASDRPYKKGKTLSEAIRIMSFMAKDQHIDKDIFDLFIRERIFDDYAKDFLSEKQIDEVNIENYI